MTRYNTGNSASQKEITSKQTELQSDHWLVCAHNACLALFLLVLIPSHDFLANGLLDGQIFSCASVSLDIFFLSCCYVFFIVLLIRFFCCFSLLLTWFLCQYHLSRIFSAVYIFFYLSFLPCFLPFLFFPCFIHFSLCESFIHLFFCVCQYVCSCRLHSLCLSF